MTVKYGQGCRDSFSPEGSITWQSSWVLIYVILRTMKQVLEHCTRLPSSTETKAFAELDLQALNSQVMEKPCVISAISRLPCLADLVLQKPVGAVWMRGSNS